MSTREPTYTATRSRAKPLHESHEKSHDIAVALRRHHLVLWFTAACVGIAIRHHRMLHWFAVVCMVAIITWVIIDLFGPVLRYKISRPLDGALDSPEFVRQLEALAASRAVANTVIEPLPNGVNFYEAEIQAIGQARKSVNWVAYIFAQGQIARRMVEALTERARAGVEVNLVIDGVGSFSMRKKFFAALTEAGGRVRWFHPLRWNNWPRANNRTHRELIVIDGQVGFIGGAGVADHWWHGIKKQAPWRDTMFKVTGDAVRFLQSSFLENWLESSGEILAGEKYFVASENTDGAVSMVVDSSPSQGGSTRARILFQTLVASAERSLKITTPYFLPDRSMIGELVRAIEERNVRVQILVPGRHSDHGMTRSSSRATYGDLLKAGAEIYEYQPAMIHAKIMIVDDLWCVVGSTNMDHRSFGWNDEVNLAVMDSALAAKLSESFAEDLEKSHRETLQEWERRSFSERAMEWLSWLIAREQ